MSEKTPIPWFTSDEGRFMNVKGDNGVIIAVRHRNPTPVHVEDMKFIVTAVNSHAALLEVKRAAEKAMAYLGEATCDGCLFEGQSAKSCANCKGKEAQDIHRELRAALKSAGGIQ